MHEDNSFPSLDAIYAELDRVVECHKDSLSDEVLGVSDEGRAVRAIHCTDRKADPEQQQVAMVVCGRHGSELGTRVVGSAVLGWLMSEAGARTRRNQRVIVVPVANPDGCARGEFHAPARHLSEVEQKTLAALADRVQPDAIIDVHSFGAGNADVQAIVTGNTGTDGEDEMIYHAVAQRLIEGAAEAGFPFVVHTTKRNEGYNNFIAGLCHQRFHTLAFGMEVNHHALTPAEAAASGTAVIGALLEAGNGRPWWEAQTGYPVNILAGDLFTSIRPTGHTAAERRVSRVAIWRDRRFFSLGQRETPTPTTLRVPFTYTGYRDDAPRHAFALCCRIRGVGKRIKARLNGQTVEATTFADACSTYVSVDVHPSGKTDYEFVLTY